MGDVEKYRAYFESKTKAELVEAAVDLLMITDGFNEAISKAKEHRELQLYALQRQVEALNQAIVHYRELEEFPKILARSGGLARSQKDPRTQLRIVAKEKWTEWKRNPSLFPSAAAFARTFVEAHPVITTTKTVEKWVTEWEREKRGMKARR